MKTLKEAVKKLDIPYPTAAKWCQQGLVKAAGGGTQAVPWKITDKEIRELQIIAFLRKRGASLQTIRRSADTLQAVGANPFSEGEFLVVDHGEEIIRRVDEETAMATVRDPGQMALPLPDDPTKEDDDG